MFLMVVFIGYLFCHRPSWMTLTIVTMTMMSQVNGREQQRQKWNTNSKFSTLVELTTIYFDHSL